MSSTVGTGGLIGYLVYGSGASQAILSNSFSTGSVNGGFNGGTASTGGLVGVVAESNLGAPTITNTYSLSTVKGTGITGGLIGDIAQFGSHTVTLSNFYSASYGDIQRGGVHHYLNLI